MMIVLFNLIGAAVVFKNEFKKGKVTGNVNNNYNATNYVNGTNVGNNQINSNNINQKNNNMM